MQVSKFYVLKDDLISSGPFDTVEQAEASARDLRETQKLILLSTRKVLKLFKKGVPLNLSDYSVIAIVKEVDK